MFTRYSALSTTPKPERTVVVSEGELQFTMQRALEDPASAALIFGMFCARLHENCEHAEGADK